MKDIIYQAPFLAHNMYSRTPVSEREDHFMPGESGEAPGGKDPRRMESLWKEYLSKTEI